MPLVSISIRYNTAPSLRPFFYIFRACMRRSGCYPGAWSSWHSQVVSLHLKSWTSLSSSFALCYILPCERALSAAPCIFILLYNRDRLDHVEVLQQESARVTASLCRVFTSVRRKAFWFRTEVRSLLARALVCRQRRGRQTGTLQFRKALD